VTDCENSIGSGNDSELGLGLYTCLPTIGSSERPGFVSVSPVFEKTCEATQKNVKSHVFLDFEKKPKKRTSRPTQPIVSQAT